MTSPTHRDEALKDKPLISAKECWLYSVLTPPMLTPRIFSVP